MAAGTRHPSRRHVGLALIAALGLVSIAMCGCAPIINYGKEWGQVGEPIGRWGSEIIGYEGKQY